MVGWFISFVGQFKALMNLAYSKYVFSHKTFLVIKEKEYYDLKRKINSWLANCKRLALFFIILFQSSQKLLIFEPFTVSGDVTRHPLRIDMYAYTKFQ